MKRTVRHTEGKFKGNDYVEYNDDVLRMSVFRDGSGDLFVDDIGFRSEEGTHKSRVQELKRMKQVINKSLKILEQIENPKEYFPGGAYYAFTL